MTFWAKQSGGLIVDRQEPLCLTGRLDPTHDLLSPLGMSVRSLGAIIQPFVLAMFDPANQVRLRGTVRSELVRDDHARLAPGLEQFPEKAHRGHLGPPGLDQNVRNIAVCIDRPPKPNLLAFDRHHDLIKIPFVRKMRPVPPDFCGKPDTETRHPIPDRFVGNRDAPRRQQIFNVAKAESKAQVSPDP